MAQKALVSLSEQWINDFRKILKLKIGKNWTVYNSRGNVRLQVGKRPNEETLTTAYKCLGFKSISSIYQLKAKGLLKPYLNRIDDKNYLFMGKIRGVTLAKHIQKNLTSNNWIQLYDYDLKKYIELSK